jgi:hypothetical protein
VCGIHRDWDSLSYLFQHLYYYLSTSQNSSIHSTHQILIWSLSLLLSLIPQVLLSAGTLTVWLCWFCLTPPVHYIILIIGSSLSKFKYIYFKFHFNMSDENTSNMPHTEPSSQSTKVSDQEKMSFILISFTHLANGQQTLQDAISSLTCHVRTTTTQPSLPSLRPSNPPPIKSRADQKKLIASCSLYKIVLQFSMVHLSLIMKN